MAITAGHSLLSSLVYSGDIQQYLKLDLRPHLFKGSEVVLYEFITDHLRKHGKIPAQATVEAHVPDTLVLAEDAPSYYLEELEKRYLHSTLKAAVQECSTLLVGKNAELALEKLTQMVGDLHMKKQRKHILDFREAADLIQETYIQQKTMSSEIVLPFGWDTLDDMSGGMRAKDFVTVVGRPMSGKTFLSLFIALNGWKLGRVPLFVSMEMSVIMLAQRLTAMKTKKKLTDLLKAELSSKAFTAMMQDLTDLKGHNVPFWVVDGNLTSTVDDLLMYARQLKPSFIVTDAAYLLQHPNPRLGKWDKQAENAQLLKQRVAGELGLPVIASYQFGKASSKAKKQNKIAELSGDDVHGSDEMFQLSSVMLGLFDDEDSIEAKKRRKVKILKGRSGETGEFPINWDFSNQMDFSEFKKEDPSELQMNHLG